MTRSLMLPCPTCNGDEFVSFEDRHSETNTSMCPQCRGERFVPANTGMTPESSAPGPIAVRRNTVELGSQARPLTVKAVRQDDRDPQLVEVQWSRSLTKDELASFTGFCRSLTATIART